MFTLGCLAASAVLPVCRNLRAQTATGTATGNATVQPAGPRAGTNGVNNFNVEGTANGTNGSLASFGVLDFPSSAFALGGQQISGAANNMLTLTLTESDAAFTLPGTIAFYLTTNTSVSISNAAGASPLRFNTATATSAFDPPYGIDTQLGTLAGGTLFSLGTGTFSTTGNTATGQKDMYTLTLDDIASAYFASALNASTSGDVRIVVAPTTATTAATFFGVGNATATNRPQLTFTPVFATANNLYWQGGTGSWVPSGGTQWNPAKASPGTTGWDNSGTAVAAFSSTPNSVVTVDGAIKATGLQFDVTGYTVAATAGSAITLSGANNTIQVTNATDTATISAPLAGTAGYNKTGAGLLVLQGANTFSGNTTLTGGTLAISATANLGTPGSGVVFNGGTLSVADTLTTIGGQRAFTGNGGNLVYSGTTPLAINGDVTLTGTLGLQGTGNVTLGDASGRGYDTVGGLNIANPVTLTSTGTLNTSAISAFHASGTVVINGNVLFNTTTTNVNVSNAGATLQITGAVGTGVVNAGGFTSGTGVLVKQGAGALDLLGDNSSLTATTATSGAVRQGTAGTTPAAGGTIMVHTATGLGTGQYQFNSGTFVNASGGMLTFANSLSIGGGQLPGGATFGGTTGASSVFTGNASLFNPTGSVYQHVITVSAPTTFTGIFSSPTTGTNNGLLIAGSSSLTLAPAGGPNTFTEDITVSGGTTLTLATTGALGANRSLTMLSNALLTLTLGTGVQDAISDAAFVSLNSGSHVTLGGDNETVGGLALNGVTQPAGTYGAPGSGATNTSAYFTGAGILTNLGTAMPIPEPATWAALLAGMASLLVFRRCG